MPIIVFFLFLLLLSACGKIETASSSAEGGDLPVPSPTIETASEAISLKPVSPVIKLTSKQRKYLNDALPPDVREILEKSETFAVLAEVSKNESSETDIRNFHPNRVAGITSEKEKKEILEAFYLDASSDDNAASCYEPHHGIRTVYQGKSVEIEICFDCARFYVTGALGKFKGTIIRDGRKSEDILNRIIQIQGVEISK